MWYDKEYLMHNIREIIVHSVFFLVLVAPVSDVQDPEWTADLHSVGVFIIQISITLSPVLWCLRHTFQILCGGSE